MASENQTVVSGFILLGFSDLSPQIQQFLFLLLLLFYLLAVMGNLLVLIILTVDPVFHTPMYFFLRILAFMEICLTSTIIPKTLTNLLSEDRSISFLGCALQMYFTFIVGVEESMILAIMAFDRYIAICNPFHYSTIMNKRKCISMAVGSWIISIWLQIVQIIFIFSLPFCRSRVIHHFFCDIPPVLKLSCTDTYLNDIICMTITVLVGFIPFLIIVSSYAYIISTVLRMNSREGRRKAFSTCSSHLAVVVLFYGTVMLAYLQPDTDSSDGRILAVFYCVINPTLNPMIYSLRNKEVKGALRKSIWGKENISFMQ
ncbi:olfactory receptor 10A4-like [Microcaecilia unicolor]|uniref:Olfactory receptor 10A4-like n=1 Tax=Microcaecilia unicolor TaxID=1415580 RepID=A0A6P7WW47_9AMPH|nr:olfactory receptor 10A4-like [Microcaecilia unicolor]